MFVFRHECIFCFKFDYFQKRSRAQRTHQSSVYNVQTINNSQTPTQQLAAQVTTSPHAQQMLIFNVITKHHNPRSACHRISLTEWARDFSSTPSRRRSHARKVSHIPVGISRDVPAYTAAAVWAADESSRRGSPE